MSLRIVRFSFADDASVHQYIKQPEIL